MSETPKLHPMSLHSTDGEFLLGWYVEGHIDPAALRLAIGESRIAKWRDSQYGPDAPVQIKHEHWRRVGNQHGGRFRYARRGQRGAFLVTVLDFDTLDLNASDE